MRLRPERTDEQDIMGRPAEPQATRLVHELFAELADEVRNERFAVAPNPCVGAAILAEGRVVARGVHREWGGPHAELEVFAAARRAGFEPETWEALVVTLEPCSSTGKTPPCTEAILATPVPTIFVGSLDPDPRHRGAGVEELRRAGREVVVLDGAVPLERVAPYFLGWIGQERLRRPRPWTIAKWAQTRSGHLIPPEHVGEGRWISGPESLAEVQCLRARVDAIVTGVGTVMADDPRLTVRPPARTDHAPARVILDTYLRTPPDARLFAAPREDERAGEVHVLCLPGIDANRQRALVEAGAQVHAIRGDDRTHLSLRGVQTWLWEHGFRRVLLEAGPTLVGAYLDAGFVDQVRIYTGNVSGGRGESLGMRLASLKLQERLDRECGDDAVLEAFLRTD